MKVLSGFSKYNRGYFKQNMWMYMLFFCMILVSDDSYWFTTSDSTFAVMVKYAFVAFLPVILFLKGCRFKKNDLALLMFMVSMMSLSTMLSGSSLGGVLMLTLTVASSMLIASKYSLFTFAKIFSDIVTVVILYSATIWILMMASVITPMDIENVAGVQIRTYAYCLFFSGYTNFIPRSSAFFREPGMFMVFIMISFIFEAFVLKKKFSIWKLLLYTLGIFSTLSTAAFIIFILAYFLYLSQNKSFSWKSYIFPIVLMTATVFIIASTAEIMLMVFGKLEKGTDSGSVLGRISSIIIPFNMMLEYPILGTGTTPFRQVYIDVGQTIFHTTVDPQGLATNTIFNAGAIFGVWLFILSLIGFYKLCKKMSRHKFAILYIWVLLLMIFSNEAMVYSIIFYILIFYGLSKSSKLYGKNNISICLHS